MAKQGTNTKKQILDAAEALLQDRGFNAFSYNDIAGPLGVKNAAVHYHFPTKADLGLALLERYRERFRQYTEMLDEGGANPLLKLEAYLTIPWRYLRSGGKCCPLGVLEAEFNAIPESMRLEVLALDQEMRDWLARALEEGRGQGLLQFEDTAEEKALLIAATLQGGLQISRAVGGEGFAACVRQLKHSLGLTNESKMSGKDKDDDSL